MIKQKITKRVADSACPKEKDYTIWDTDLTGFGLRIYPSRRKVFLYKYRVGGGRGGTIRKPVIGKFGEITVDQARGIAKDWAASVRQGQDPSNERAEKRRAATMETLFERYLNEHARPHKKASSVKSDITQIDRFLRPTFGKRKIEEITRAQVNELHQSLKKTPYQANRLLALISKMFNLAEIWELRPDGSNPCRHIKKFKEARRERFLSQIELARLGKALNDAQSGIIRTQRGSLISRNAVTAIQLLIFTGARKSEILKLMWSEVNIVAARLELSDSKTGRRFVHLPPPALGIMLAIERSSDNPYVIVGGKVGTHLVNIKDPWYGIRHAAGLHDVRLHDLRHSFASVGASNGMSLPIIGALLGHKEIATTARYAHLSDDPLKIAGDQIGNKIADCMGVNAHLVDLPLRDASNIVNSKNPPDLVRIIT